jgi:hypothetical protein
LLIARSWVKQLEADMTEEENKKAATIYHDRAAQIVYDQISSVEAVQHDLETSLKCKMINTLCQVN